MRKLGCVTEVKLWVFEKNNPKRPNGSRGETKTWHPITPSLKGTTLSFKDEDTAMLLSMMT